MVEIIILTGIFVFVLLVQEYKFHRERSMYEFQRSKLLDRIEAPGIMPMRTQPAQMHPIIPNEEEGELNLVGKVFDLPVREDNADKSD